MSFTLDSFQLLQFREDRMGRRGMVVEAMDEVLEEVRTNMNWVSLNKEEVMEWFSREASSG